MNEKLKAILNKLKNPSAGLLLVAYGLTLVFCTGAIWLAVVGTQNAVLEILSYVFYALAAISLGYSVYTIVLFAPTMKTRLVSWIKKYAIGRRLLEQYEFRTVVFAAFSLLVNVAYVALNIVLAIISAPFWYGSLAAYYGLLVALRSGVVLYHKNKGKSSDLNERERAAIELKKYKNCGIMLTIIPLCLVVPILQIAFLGRAFTHEGWTVIAFAAYAFYKIVMAILNALKANKRCDYTVQAVRNVGLADALVSIFSLQTALLFSYAEAGADYAVFNILTATVVCVLTITLGITMIIKANKEKRMGEEDGKQI